MRDRDIALGYQAIKNESDATILEYKEAYERLALENLPSLGKTICLNDNFAINSIVKRALSCSEYDTVVLNGTHQRYCFHICGESLFVDSFYMEIPDLDSYDTILVDSSNINEAEYLKLLSMANDDQNLITVYDGTILLSTPDGEGNHIPIAQQELEIVSDEDVGAFDEVKFIPTKD